MKRLALVLVAVLSSYAVACAAPTTDGTDTAPPAAEEAAETLEVKPLSAPTVEPAAGERAFAREDYAIEKEADGAFVERRVGDTRVIPTPTPKPGAEIDALAF